MDIYVIHLKQRYDKKKYILNHLNDHNIIHYTIFDGIRIKKEELSRIHYIKSETFLNYLNLNYVLGASGCKISHYECLKSVNKNKAYSLILEDAVVLEPYFRYYIYFALEVIQNKNLDFDLLYLGANLEKKEDAYLIEPNILKILKPKTTTAYLVNHSSLDKILDIIDKSTHEIDEVYASSNELNKLCVYPMIAHQNDLSSDIVNNNDYQNYHEKFSYE